MQIAFPSSHQNAVTAEPAGGLDVRQPVTHPPRPPKINVERFLRVEKQLECRLAALTGSRELRMMGADVRAIEACAMRREQLADASLDSRIVGDGVETAGDPRLVRDNDDEVSVVVETLDPIRRAGEQSHPAGLMQVTSVFDDRAVAIEKDGALAVSHQPSAISHQP